MNKRIVAIIVILIILFALVIGAVCILKNKQALTKIEEKKMNEISSENINSDENKQKVLNNTSFNFETKTVKLNSGYEMPILGLGTWTQNDEETANSVYCALKDGYRLIDTVQYYNNEVGVGKAIEKAIKEGFVTREEIFITTKVSPDNYYNTDNSIDEVLRYATITPAVIQNENHLYYQNIELQEYVKEYGIIIESWYPFGGRGHTSEHFNNSVIKELATKYDKTSAQIILRWQLQAGYIVIPGSSNPNHIVENYNVFDFELSSEDMKMITNLNKNERYENW